MLTTIYLYTCPSITIIFSFRIKISLLNYIFHKVCIPLSITFGNCHPLRSIPKEIYTRFRPIYSFSRFLELPFLSSLRRLFRVLPPLFSLQYYPLVLWNFQRPKLPPFEFLWMLCQLFALVGRNNLCFVTTRMQD